MNEQAIAASIQRGAEAAQLMNHPLIGLILSDMAEKTTLALLTLPVAAHDERLALCTTLLVLRRIPEALRQMAESGEFDARQLAQMRKHDA